MNPDSSTHIDPDERADYVALHVEYAAKIPGANPIKAFIALADMVADLMRELDERRDGGSGDMLHCPPSATEKLLRRAVAPLLEKR